MRILITGDRSWRSPELAERIINRLLARYGPGIVIVHGGATGIDLSFSEACDELGVEQEVHPAQWTALDVPGAVVRQSKDGRRYNANAGPDRNREMVAAGAEFCVAFHRDFANSKGTKDCVRQALAAGIRVWLINSEAGIPVRLRSV